ncbi:alpha/beta hydrolase [Xanthomonas bonasiae]|uniref:alpha/beta hydrolase n=1 Tax=Xanthomonas bonasiae TaxID=2810351 RepID=UPI0017828800|nr:alpha/beta hydrolase [Xanthomonas surreyensis]MBD7923517.1 alpha/beta hydrolase [Xanthomonas surreyensis]
MSSIAHAQSHNWQPAEGHTQLPLWPGTPPNAQPVPGEEVVTSRSDPEVAGKPWAAVTNVTRPTITVYSPKGRNTGAAVVVFPGGGFQVLAMDLEGTEVCDWLNSQGITCVLLKYRVPSAPYSWQCACYPDLYTESTVALQDAQRAIGLVRLHAREWRIDPKKVGVVGFSAGGYLVAETSTRFKKRLYEPVDAADQESARPDFAIAIYPGRLATNDDKLNPNVPVSGDVPPTFLLQAQDDHTDGVNQAMVYYSALRKANVPAEIHLYAAGGHAFGLRKSKFAITDWPKLAEVWLRSIGVLPEGS